jgi:hypothetical protein
MPVYREKTPKFAMNLFLTYNCSSFASTFDGNELDISGFLKTSKVLDSKVYIGPGTVYVNPNQILLNI